VVDDRFLSRRNSDAFYHARRESRVRHFQPVFSRLDRDESINTKFRGLGSINDLRRNIGKRKLCVRNDGPGRVFYNTRDETAGEPTEAGACENSHERENSQTD
jgi:hypothetical protein